MKRFAILSTAIFLLLASTAMAGWDRPMHKVDYDSIGVYTVAGQETVQLDTITAWIVSANGHTADANMDVRYWEMGGGAYTSVYLWAYPTTSPHADSVKAYVVLEQSIGGNAVWANVDSVSVTTASTAAGKKVTLNGMPYLRIRTQEATASDGTTGTSVLIKLFFIR